MPFRRFVKVVFCDISISSIGNFSLHWFLEIQKVNDDDDDQSNHKFSIMTSALNTLVVDLNSKVVSSESKLINFAVHEFKLGRFDFDDI